MDERQVEVDLQAAIAAAMERIHQRMAEVGQEIDAASESLMRSAVVFGASAGATEAIRASQAALADMGISLKVGDRPAPAGEDGPA